MPKVYVVIASEGEYSDRSEWVCGVFTDKANAIALAEEHKRKAMDDDLIYRKWLKANWKIREEWGIANKTYGFKCPASFIEEKIGKPPHSPEADDFTVFEGEIDVWGKFI